MANVDFPVCCQSVSGPLPTGHAWNTSPGKGPLIFKPFNKCLNMEQRNYLRSCWTSELLVLSFAHGHRRTGGGSERRRTSKLRGSCHQYTHQSSILEPRDCRLPWGGIHGRLSENCDLVLEGVALIILSLFFLPPRWPPHLQHK